jgi:hypothetical protein
VKINVQMYFPISEKWETWEVEGHQVGDFLVWRDDSMFLETWRVTHIEKGRGIRGMANQERWAEYMAREATAILAEHGFGKQAIDCMRAIRIALEQAGEWYTPNVPDAVRAELRRWKAQEARA